MKLKKKAQELIIIEQRRQQEEKKHKILESLSQDEITRFKKSNIESLLTKNISGLDNVNPSSESLSNQEIETIKAIYLEDQKIQIYKNSISNYDEDKNMKRQKN